MTPYVASEVLPRRVLTDVDGRDAAARVQIGRDGQASGGAERACRGAARIAVARVSRAVCGEELARRARVVGDVQAQERDARPESGGGGGEEARLLAAGRAPRGPLVDDDGPAAQRGEARAEAVVQAIVGAGPVGATLALALADAIGREVIADELRRNGADVTEVVAYRTVIADAERDGEPDIYRLLLERKIDVVTFTSPSAVRNFVSVVGAEPAADLLRPTAVASIGPVAAEAAAQFNIQTTIMPAQYTIPALAAAIVKFFEGAEAKAETS